MISNGAGNLKAGAVFLCAAVLCAVIFTAFTASWRDYAKTASTAAGIITEVRHSGASSKGSLPQRSRDNYIEVEYTVDGAVYSSRVMYESGYKKGAHVKVYYQAHSPEDGRLKPKGGKSIAIIAIGLFGFIGAAGLVSGFREFSAYKKLLKNSAELTFNSWTEEDVPDSRLKRAVFVYNDPSGEKLEFRSESYDPSKPPYKQGKPVSVFVDTDDPSKYYIK